MLWLLLLDVDGLVAQLGDDSYAVREEATQALIDMGKKIEPVLRAVATADLEVQWRLKFVLKVLAASKEAELVVGLMDASGRARYVVPRDGALDLGFARWNASRLPIPFDRIVAVGGSFALARRNAVYRENDLSMWKPIVLKEICRPMVSGVPAVFQLPALVKTFPEADPILEKLERESSDPIVREVCRRARKNFSE